MTHSGESSDQLNQLCELSTLIERRRALGDTGALRIGDQGYSYAQLATLVEQRAAALIDAGVTAGELVLCQTTPVLDSVLMQWALARLGVAMLPIRADLPGSRRESLIRATGAEWWWWPVAGDADLALLIDAEVWAEGRTQRCVKRIAETQRQTVGALIRSGAPSLSASTPLARPAATARPAPPTRPAPAHPAPSASPKTVVTDASTIPAVLVETSGSSAEPKIAMLSATNIVASCSSVNARLELKRGDRWLCVLPRHHVGGLAIGYRCALAGAELIVQSHFEAERVQTALRDEQITHLSLVPAMLEHLLRIDVMPAPRLRVVLLGGQGLDASLAQHAVQHGWPLYLGYGMTETFSQVAGDWIDSNGAPPRGLMLLDGVEANCQGCAEAPQQRQPLRIRAPMLMLGYANPRRSLGEGLTDGWLQTSDLACQLPSGGLQVQGRADDVVLIAGINVLPAEIERELTRLEQIDEVAVVGVSDPTWGHRLVALYAGDLKPAQLEAWCRSKLPSHRRPRSFARLERLPTLSCGKRDRQALIAHAEALATR